MPSKPVPRIVLTDVQRAWLLNPKRLVLRKGPTHPNTLALALLLLARAR